ncbi:hypothetical protein H257_07728 [Aphanomyces astaci]|uniref:Leucine zipper transcription factor-like protein 1 n=1 Tax=Aphanomyces astaci TaxID=112090 RepID=W4GJ30_APHAT|nr:hypothetical protein H257_07728 [Aphanomyces astaci]ETV78938.1 hypothetical protein H257_07728 [Aphanomyces astaci]|eukprot:XP_009831657.1 hypothetical protein H257_07728 [Aphanomyces astaci]
MSKGLNAHHQQEISKFLKFFRSRLATHIENIDAEFEDTLSDRLSSDDVYSQKDVTDVLKSLSFAVKANARSELQDTINMTALLLRQVFHEAQDNRLNIELDTGIVEDKDMLEKVERMSVAEWAADERRPDGKKQPTKPSRHHDEEFEVLEKDNHSLRLRVEQLQKDVAKAAKDKQRAQDDMDELRQAAHASRHVDALEKELRESRDIIADYERSAKEANQHITQTKQFQQLKKMVGQKNDALKALRKRLLKFEPDADIDDVDDDDE